MTDYAKKNFEQVIILSIYLKLIQSEVKLDYMVGISIIPVQGSQGCMNVSYTLFKCQPQLRNPAIKLIKL
jgi:hypothetical protein